MKHRSSCSRRSTAPVSAHHASPVILSGPVAAAVSGRAKFFLPAIATALMLTGGSALAAVATYNGTSTTFSTAFTGGAGPNGQPATGDSLLFNAGTAGSTTLSDDLLTPAAYSLAGITFSSTASAFTINPATAGTNGFTLLAAASGGTGITNNSTNLETINDLITLSGVQTFTTTAGGGNLTLGGVVSGGGITTAGSGTLTLSNSNTFTGATNIASGTVLTATLVGGLGTSSNTAGVVDNGTLNLTAAGSTYTFGGSLTGSGILNVNVSSGGNTTSLNSNLGSFAGTLNVNESGTSGGKLQINQGSLAASAINVATGATAYFNSASTTIAAAISVGGGATGEPYGQLRFGGGTNTLSGPITLTGTVTTGNFTIADFNGNLAVSGAIGQTGGTAGTAQSLSVEGQNNGNVITLAAANTYTGTTLVGGSGLGVNLRVNGSIGSTAAPAGALTVTNSSILSGAGNGTTTGILTVSSATFNTGTFLTPGATTGATTGALTLNTTSGITLNGTLAIGITATGGTSLSTNGALTLGSASILTVAGTSGAAAYDIANYGSETGTFATTTSIPSGYTINYAGSTFSAHDIELDVTAVPEPSTWIGGAVMLLSTFEVMRRRRKIQVA